MAKATKKAAKKTAKKAPNKAVKSNGAPKGDAPAEQNDGPPSLNILGQYLKDLSFENPNAPQSLAIQDGQPEINISVNVNAKNLAPTDFEVELHIEAQATHQGNAVFAAELLYAGIFRLENIPEDALHPIILVECPRMIFPFARQILADATQKGGFPPLMLDPIDFASMYEKRVAEGDDEAVTA
ncbi:MAG: protein-export chaperone SecB [Devosiaceae bacterium]|uniref:Protein-export protein SecB (Maintains pre-export unfolded state) n=1 Tax=hydrothermal vent metagenome TaxID=652676 RepID=A0A3B0S9Q6_9ZZZZ|nr:protein-export chaperone SecB [Devosiaceae bacterium]